MNSTPNMKLISVNVALHTSQVQEGAETVTTGIVKLPMQGQHRVETLGLAGDQIVHTKHHGGPDQAVYLYTLEDYAWWEQELATSLAPGTFGENLTLQGCSSQTLNIGDRFQIGEVLLEVTAARIPCGIFAGRMQDLNFVKRFRDAQRPGAYCRVLNPGTLEAGQAVEFLPTSDPKATLLETFLVHYDKKPEKALLERLLTAPIAIRARQDYLKQLQKR